MEAPVLTQVVCDADRAQKDKASGILRQATTLKDLMEVYEPTCIECADKLTGYSRIHGLCNTCAEREEII